MSIDEILWEILILDLKTLFKSNEGSRKKVEIGGETEKSFGRQKVTFISAPVCLSIGENKTTISFPSLIDENSFLRYISSVCGYNLTTSPWEIICIVRSPSHQSYNVFVPRTNQLSDLLNENYDLLNLGTLLNTRYKKTWLFIWIIPLRIYYLMLIGFEKVSLFWDFFNLDILLRHFDKDSHSPPPPDEALWSLWEI